MVSLSFLIMDVTSSYSNFEIKSYYFEEVNRWGFFKYEIAKS